MPYFKIASADITNKPFLEKIGNKGKPVVLSTGASSLAEIEDSVNILKNNGAPEVALLHCVLNYPTDNNKAYLNMISSLRRCFPNNIIGYSDHTLPDQNMDSCVTAWLLGALIIEKHYTYDKERPGNDHYHAMDYHDLKRLVEQITKIKELRGPICIKAPTPFEDTAIKNARRSIVLNTNLKVGDVIKENHLTYKRPGTGISPMNWNYIIGRKVSKDLNEDHILMWSDLID